MIIKVIVLFFFLHHLVTNHFFNQSQVCWEHSKKRKTSKAIVPQTERLLCLTDRSHSD